MFARCPAVILDGRWMDHVVTADDAAGVVELVSYRKGKPRRDASGEYMLTEVMLPTLVSYTTSYLPQMASALNTMASTAAGIPAIYNTLHTAFQERVVKSGSLTLNNSGNLLDELVKIKYNTGYIVENTAKLLSNPAHGAGVYATGGVVPPGAPFIFGEHGPRGPILGINGPRPLGITPGVPTFGNDNSELRSIRAELKQLRAAVDRGTETQMSVGRYQGEHAQRSREVTEDGLRRVANRLKTVAKDPNRRWASR
jgi:hypothetical protein